jgi:hypothetical protein
MDNNILKLLEMIYSFENGFYNDKEDRHEHKIPENILKNDLDKLKQLGFSPNNFETIEHDTAINRFIKLKIIKY